MEIIVPDDQLSLAIGRRGQNVRLASQLTGWRLDIISESKVNEIKERAFQSLGRLKGVNDIHLQTLYNYGIRQAQDVLNTEETFLANIPGIGEDFAKRLKEDAVRVVEEEKQEEVDAKKRQEVEAREEARRMFQEATDRTHRMPEADRIVRVRGMSETLALQLETAGLHTVEDIAGLTEVRNNAEKIGLTPEKLDQLRHAAGIYIQKEKSGRHRNPRRKMRVPRRDTSRRSSCARSRRLRKRPPDVGRDCAEEVWT